MEDLNDDIIEELKQKAIERIVDEPVIDNDIQHDQENLTSPEPLPVLEEEPDKKVKKPKKPRSEKQKAAFEKARIKRAENLKVKKELEAEKKQQKKQEKELVKKEVKERISQKDARPEPKHNPTRPKDINRFQNDLYDAPEQPFLGEKVVNNYYYYGRDYLPQNNPTRSQGVAISQGDPSYYNASGVEPPALRGQGETIKPRKTKKKPESLPEPEPYYSSSEEEIIYSDPDEPESYKDLQNYTETPKQTPPPQSGLKFRFA